MYSTYRIFGLAAVLLVAAGPVAIAQTPAAQPTGPAQTQEMAGGHQGMAPMGGRAEASMTPTLPGQDAFGAIQEIVRILKADPKTDWSKVDLEALREHLIDMNEVTLKAQESTKRIPGGIRVAVTGTGRTIAAIKRMVPDQAAMIEKIRPDGWSAKTKPLANGVVFIVTAQNPKQVEIIRGLGFIGVLASGDYHQMHHLAMAKGEFMHMH